MHSFAPLTPTVFLERSGDVFRDCLAVQEGSRSLSYGQLLVRARRLASMLVSCGVRYGDAVAILADNGIEVIEANFGIPGAGGVVVTLNPWLPVHDLAAQLRLLDRPVLIASHDCLARYPELPLATLVRRTIAFGPGDGAAVAPYEALLRSGEAATPLNAYVRSELDPAVINFTSGTTSKPKGVVMSHRAAYLHALGQTSMLRLTRSSRYLWTLPMFHVNGWGHIWANAAMGAAQVVAPLPESSPEAESSFVHLMERAAVTHLAGAPRLLRRLTGMPGALRVLKGCTVMTGGAAPTLPLVESLEASGAELVHQYGLNETFGPYVVCEEQPGWAENGLPARAALRCRQGVASVHAGTGLAVRGEDGREVPRDGKTLGEVVMAGNTVALGYFKDPEATARAFVEGWFHSGDVAVVHPDGYIEIKDRKKDLIHVETQYGWENISSLEVENVLTQCPGVADAALIGVRPSDAEEGAELVGVIEPSGAAPPTVQSLRQHCERHLPQHMRPRHFVLWQIPKTATGKIRKDLLLQRAERELGLRSEVSP